MNERRREQIALFRYGVISDFVQVELVWGERERLLESKTSCPWLHPDGQTRSISRATIKQWIRKYRQGGIDGLKPRIRCDKGERRAIEPELAGQLIQLRLDHHDWGVPELARHIRRLDWLPKTRASASQPSTAWWGRRRAANLRKPIAAATRSSSP